MKIKIKKLISKDENFKKKLYLILKKKNNILNENVDLEVAKILDNVKKYGDKSIIEYTNFFDKLNISCVSSLKISLNELKKSLKFISKKNLDSLYVAADRIRKFHEYQKLNSGLEGFSYIDKNGNTFSQRILPIKRIGVYVPGGTASYPSSVLMNVIPAKVAGVKEIIMMVPTPHGIKNPLVFAAAYISGINEVFTIGGAQAIGALCYGTKNIKKVDKIVGPGNIYVSSAKRKVFGSVGIDMIAGPSEIVIICDGNTNPEWIVMDLFAQAEHDILSQSILICPDEKYLLIIEKIINKRINNMLRKNIIYKSIINYGLFIKTNNLKEACKISNIIAPEHLEISTKNPNKYLKYISNAGSIFLGSFSSECIGDYCAGPNHVLPTLQTSRFSSPLGVYDFIKRSSITYINKISAKKLGNFASNLALCEGLQAHSMSVLSRI
ncbi:histidinol dehydrogenase [Candidatus Zinderia endosymbiont of Aphrophora alni]|uniref:histidinol dehydrogenase n=1 Tax=Candidatus Zinderia endosymbiont of Aphrophora alni TaxID=3077951 RepID=UPI0030D45D0B